MHVAELLPERMQIFPVDVQVAARYINRSVTELQTDQQQIMRLAIHGQGTVAAEIMH